MTIAASSAWDLKRNLDTVSRQWTGLLVLCDVPEAYAVKSSTVSGWGVGQHVHHLGIENDLIADALEKVLVDPSIGVGLVPTHPAAIPILERGRIPRGGGQAPEILHPPPVPMRADTRALIESAKRRWGALTDRREELQRSSATHPHPILGPFTPVHWVRFIAMHTAHHLKIVREILEAAGLETPFDKSLEAID